MALRHRWLAVLTAFALVLAGVLAVMQLRASESRSGAAAPTGECAPGFQPVHDALREIRAEMRTEEDFEELREEGEVGEQAREAELVREAVRELPMLQGTDPDDWDSLCVVSKRPESLKELNALFDTRAISRLAPFGAYDDGAATAAARQSAALSRASVPGTKGRAKEYGKGPLIVDDENYPQVNGLGLEDNMGRIDDYAWDPKGRRLFAAVGSGGIWRSDDMAASWKDATGNLPTTVTGAVGWTRAKGGTLLALTGEPTFGSSAYTGLGAYWSGNLGKSWKRSKGVPAGALGFAIAVDPKSPKKVYAATQYGLFVSTNAGRSYKNAKLPTGPCAGVTNMSKKPQCALASVVTDVVVVEPGGVNTETKAGTVVATVGWRGGQRTNPDGTVQSPNNGIYRSGNGKPGSFEKLETTGFAAQDAIGRTELGHAVGPEQDHDFLYAIVQDANLLNNGGLLGIDAPEGFSSPLGSTVLNGIYVSDDFGQSWTVMATGTTLAADPTTGSALIGTGTATGYQPGVQGWYNLWVQPDPSRATAAGVPTRMVFGLEELWANDLPQLGQPLDGTTPVHFGVIGKYFGGDSCLLLNVGLPACPTDRDPTDDNSTTHPDQQDGIWILDPKADNGVQLVVGNDGGAYRYRFEEDSDEELDNANWGRGDQNGFQTLLPYWAAMANDGTVWAGLQDNGNMKIDGKTRKQYETYGGDGFFTAVDPFDSNISYEEYTNGAISVTTDGGSSWSSIDPGLTAARFSNPFAMDPTNAQHLVTAGREVVETLLGPSTTSGFTEAADADDSTSTWVKVFDLGTRTAPGDPAASSSATDPDNSMTAITTRGDATYVGFCGQCDTLNKLVDSGPVFKNGLATNVGGDKRPKAGTSNGWHVVKAKGLPNRYITSIAIDPDRSKTIYVTVGGYTRRWMPPGAAGDTNKAIGKGHLFRSTNGGKSFKDITGNLPDSPATAVTVRKNQLLVGTDVGAFASGPNGKKESKPRFARLKGMPPAPVSSIQLKPDNPNLAVLALFGRGVWTYKFKQKVKVPVVNTGDGGSNAPKLDEVVESFDFEDGAQGWTASGFPGRWAQGAPGHGKGTEEDPDGSAWAVSGPIGYTDLADVTLTSPAVDMPKGKGLLQWWMRLDTEGGYDIATLEVSQDGGDSWQLLGSYSGGNPDAPGWSKYTAPIAAGGGEVIVRFHFTADEICSNLGGPICSSTSGWDGVHVDDLVLGTAK